MSKYTKQHYEDVASLLDKQPVASVGSLRQAIKRVVEDFADLFATDNPPTCIVCYQREGEPGPTCFPSAERTGHDFSGGFNREPFLAACGLEPGPRVPLSGPDADGNVPEPPECPNCGQTTHTIGECV